MPIINQSKILAEGTKLCASLKVRILFLVRWVKRSKQSLKRLRFLFEGLDLHLFCSALHCILGIGSTAMRSMAPITPEQESRLDNPIHQRRHIRMVCIGAGASGLLFAYKLQRSFEEFSLDIYEKNQGVSGTWFENRYPG